MKRIPIIVITGLFAIVPLIVVAQTAPQPTNILFNFESIPIGRDERIGSAIAILAASYAAYRVRRLFTQRNRGTTDE